MRFTYEELVAAGADPKWDVRSITMEEYTGLSNYSIDIALNILKKRRKSSYADRRVSGKLMTRTDVRIVDVKREDDYGCHFPEICSPQQWPCDQCWHRVPGTVFCHPSGLIQIAQTEGK